MTDHRTTVPLSGTAQPSEALSTQVMTKAMVGGKQVRERNRLRMVFNEMDRDLDRKEPRA